jgi:hypothetical protein
LIKHESGIYTERHHIIPKCIGGTDEPSNIVRLSAREHYIAHRLLVKFTIGNTFYKMNEAFSIFSHNKNRKLRFNSRDISVIREANSIASSKRNMGNNNWTFRKEPPESKLRLSIVSSSSKWVNNGIVESFTRGHLDMVNSGYVYGRKKFSDSTLQSMRSVATKICEHCAIEITIGAYRVHHGDRCKLNPKNAEAQSIKLKEKQAKEILAKAARKASYQPVQRSACIHCNYSCDSRNMRKHHGDMCKHNPNPSMESLERKRITSLNNSLGQSASKRNRDA